MEYQTAPTWDQFNYWSYRHHDLGLYLDVSRMGMDDDFIDRMQPQIQKSFDDMKALESGAIANPDEDRMVGHYWLRQAALAPDKELTEAIQSSLIDIKEFTHAVHDGNIVNQEGKPFEHVLIVGIGGSALGPQFIADALGTSADPMSIHFIDNTDPDGISRVLDRLEHELSQTLVVVISKSGGTKETRNGMLEVRQRLLENQLSPASQMVAITGEGSQLDQVAVSEGWLKRFPMWDWVGGRTSVMSTVGLVPMALQGLDIDQFLEGAAMMDAGTRQENPKDNPAMLLALAWYHAGCGRGMKDMVIIPYKDRLVLFSKYLQQLVMESLGKKEDLDGNEVFQGLAVYGNKGSTDQHAYVQQLRDGIHNFFLTLIEVRKATDQTPFEVEEDVTSGDYLQGFLRGTRAALAEGDRETITLSVPIVDAKTVGALIALYERAVGYYASLIHINAYHQPGVEAGKKAATRLLELQSKVIAAIKEDGEGSANSIAVKVGADPEDVYHLLVHLANNRNELEHELRSRPDQDVFRYRS